MEQQISNPVEVTQIAMAKKMLALENQIKGGTGWFFWIAGLSVLNTVIFLAGGSLTFVVGLGTTQLIDGFTFALAHNASSGVATVLRVIGFGLDLFIASIFMVFGILGRKRYRWAIIIGMILYVMDGLISLAFKDWFGAFFHFLALVGLFHGLKAISELTQLEKNLSLGDMALLQKLTAEKPPTDPVKSGKNLLRFAVIIIIPFVFMIGIMLLMIWFIQK